MTRAPHQQSKRSVLWLYVVLTLSACGGGSDSPTSPSPTSSTPTVTTVTVSGCTTADNFQCRAQASFSSGTSQDVTSQAQWSVSDPALASISASGAMQALASGDIQVRATYQGVSGTRDLRLTVTPVRTFTLAGVVADMNGRALAGASVSARDEAGNTRSGTTNGDGYFSLAPLREGSVTVNVSASGYVATSRTVALGSDTRMPDILLAPAATTPTPSNSCSGVPSRADCGTPTARCNNGQWSCSQNRSGTCSSNGGVSCWVCPGRLC